MSDGYTLQMPKYDGHYCIGGSTYFPVRKKPRWLTRFLLKHLLEWEWRDG